MGLGSGPGKGVEFAVGGLVYVEASDVRCDLVLLSLVRRDDEIQQVAFLSQMRRRGVPRGQGDGLDGLRGRVAIRREKRCQRRCGVKVILGDRGRLARLLLGRGNAVEEGYAGKDSLDGVGSVPGSADKLPDSDQVNSSLLLRVRILHQVYLGVGAKATDLGYLDEVVDALVVVFEVEARVFEGDGMFNNGLSDLVDLLLRRNLAVIIK